VSRVRSVKNNPKYFFWASLFGTVNFLNPVMTLFYFKRGLAPGDLFILMLCFSMSVLVFEVPTGVFADRFGQRTAIVAGGVTKLVSTVLLFFAYDPWVFFLTRVLDGLAGAFTSGASEALIYDSMSETQEQHRVGEVWGKIRSASYIPVIAANILGAVVAHDLSEGQFRLLIALSVALSLGQCAMLSLLVNPSASERQTQESVHHHITHGLKVLRSSPALVFIFFNFTLVFIPTYVFARFVQPFLVGAGLPVALLGVVYTAESLLSMVGSRMSGRIISRFSMQGVMALSGVLILTGLVLAIFVRDNLWLGCLSMFLVAVPMCVRWPIYFQLQGDYIPDESRATTISLLSIIDSFFDLAILLALREAAADHMGPVFVGCAVVVALGLVFPVRERKQIPHEKGTPAAAAS
jgi:MFS family permease